MQTVELKRSAGDREIAEAKVATISQKIFSRASGSPRMVEPGEIVEADVDYAMSHDGTSVLAIKAFQEMGSEKVWDPERIVIPFDHIVPANNETVATLQKEVRSWISEQGITNFFDCGRGVCHQVFPEQGFALPGFLVVGADSHSCTYGAFGAFGTGVGATDMAEIYSCGRLWFKVPETYAVRISGRLSAFRFCQGHCAHGDQRSRRRRCDLQDPGVHRARN